MTSRERVLAALEYRRPDRVPVDFSGHRSSGIAAIAYAKLWEYLRLPAKPIRVYDVIQQLAVVDDDVLAGFYKSVRPFGLWSPVRKQADLPLNKPASKSENVSLTIINVVLGMVAICGLYLSPMYLVGHWYAKSLIWLGAAFAAIAALAFTWYPNLVAARLPAEDE